MMDANERAFGRAKCVKCGRFCADVTAGFNMEGSILEVRGFCKVHRFVEVSEASGLGWIPEMFCGYVEEDVLFQKDPYPVAIR